MFIEKRDEFLRFLPVYNAFHATVRSGSEQVEDIVNRLNRVTTDRSSWNSLTFPWQFPDIAAIVPDVIHQYFMQTQAP